MTINKPIVYILHDHHVIDYNTKTDMHLNCDYKSSSYFNQESQAQVMYAEFLRRCLFILTPSESNKRIFKEFIPEIQVQSAPNRQVQMNPSTIKVFYPPRNSRPFKILVIGALSPGKGLDAINHLASTTTSSFLQVYHIGKASQTNPTVKHLGRFESSLDMIQMVKLLDPHLVWFPPIRHESFCYMLDDVIYLSYPILASGTGSFPERYVAGI